MVHCVLIPFPRTDPLAPCHDRSDPAPPIIQPTARLGHYTSSTDILDYPAGGFALYIACMHRSLGAISAFIGHQGVDINKTTVRLQTITCVCGGGVFVCVCTTVMYW